MAGDVSTTGQEPGSAKPVRPAVPDAPLALYRRYRPATFAEVKGQDHVTEPLRQALRSGRVHHAYLFSGPRGCGKTSSARILARSLNCEAGPTPDPCGKCASCIALAPAGPGSIDVIEIDAASHGGIDDARDLRERAFYSPVAARYKIYIIDEAHMVTGGGFNALLKLVEEPPPHLKFVFATTEPEKVIPTIRSRTHHYPFRLVPPAVLRDLLEQILAAEGIAYEPAVLPVVIRAGTGSVRDSLSVLDQLMAGADETGLRYDRAIALLGYTDDALLDEMAEAFAAADGAAIFGTVDHVVEAGHDPRRFATDLLDRLRDLIILAAVPDAAASGLLDAPADQLERMRKQAADFGQDRLVRAAETVSSGLVEMRGATSPRLLLELMCAQVLVPAGPAAASDLAARIDRLERHISAAPGTRPASPAGSGSSSPADPAGHRDAARDAARDASPRSGQGPEGPPSGGTTPAAARPAAAASAGPPARAAGADPLPPRDLAMARAGESGRGTSASRAGDSTGGHPGTSSGAPAGGPADAAAVLNRWPDVLDAVRSVSRVAWILLANATLDSVQDGVLTLAFEREGDAKGFGSSGSSDFLAKVLDQMFGVPLAVRTSVLHGAGTGAAGRPRRADSQAGSGTGQRPDGADAAQPDSGRADPGRPDPGRADPGRPGPRGTGADTASGGDQGDDRGGGVQAGESRPGESPPGDLSPGASLVSAAGGPLAADGADPAGGAASAGTAASTGTASGSGTAGPPGAAGGSIGSGGAGDRSRSRQPRKPGRADGRSIGSVALSDDPRLDTDSEPAGEGAGDALSGSDLIERALGGHVIEEIGGI